VFAILKRVILLPIQKYQEYFGKYRQLADSRPLAELADPAFIQQSHSELVNRDLAGGLTNPRSDAEMDRLIRDGPVDQLFMAHFQRTDHEVRQRAAFEDGIKRPYFHTTELSPEELSNWRLYLDFEETTGNQERINFLYGRCIVICALYEEFWLRYVRWLQAQPDKEQEIRIIFQRACTVWVPIAKPAIRRQYAIFEEMEGRLAVARDQYRAILYQLPNDVETIVALANLERRAGGIDAAIAVYYEFLQSRDCDIYDKAIMVVEWANLLWKIKGSPEEAREVFAKQAVNYPQARSFWVGYFYFEQQQPTSAATEATQHERIKGVFDVILEKSQIHPAAKKDIAQVYMDYLMQRGTTDAAKEWSRVDRDING
jgi:pre-mRNA-processing factor 39